MFAQYIHRDTRPQYLGPLHFFLQTSPPNSCIAMIYTNVVDRIAHVEIGPLPSIAAVQGQASINNLVTS